MEVLDKIMEDTAKKAQDAKAYQEGYDTGFQDGYSKGLDEGFEKAKKQYRSKNFYDPLGEEER